MTSYLEDDLCEVYLPAQINTLAFGTNLFASLLPDQPDSASALFEHPGQKPQFTMGPNTLPAFTMPAVQVMTRDASYVAARSAANAIYRALIAVVNQTVNGTYYERIEADSEPYLLHRDSNTPRRNYFVCNYTVWRTPS